MQMPGRLLLLVGLMFVMVGCGPPRSKVSGTVSYKGKLLSQGTVIFIASDKQVYPAEIQPDGSYSHPGIPRGRVEVSVQQEEPRPVPRPEPSKGKVSAEDDAKMAGREPPPFKGVRIPMEYSDPKKSGLGFDINQPEHQFDIDLK
ncbi:MAG: hypothetical protein SNJ75_09540 [Gemmataceae bacterium]